MIRLSGEGKRSCVQSKIRLPEEQKTILLGLQCCGTGGTYDCGVCPYFDRAKQSLSTCRTLLHEDILREAQKELDMRALTNARRAERRTQSPKLSESRSYNALYMQRLREKWKAQGLCVQCGKARPVDGKTKCPACALRAAEQRARKREREKSK